VFLPKLLVLGVTEHTLHSAYYYNYFYVYFKSWFSGLWHRLILLTFQTTLLTPSSGWSESGMLVSHHNTVRCHNSEDRNLNLHRHENLKSHLFVLVDCCEINLTVTLISISWFYRLSTFLALLWVVNWGIFLILNIRKFRNLVVLKTTEFYNKPDPVPVSFLCTSSRMIRVRIPAWARNFYPRHRVQNGSAAHPASHPLGIGGKAAGAWTGPLTSI
jgi:hypothetical protein